jgi:hypothetical protein
MSTAAYGIEATWEGQTWLLDRLSVAIGRAVAGTFSTAKGKDAIRASDIPHQTCVGSQAREATGSGTSCAGWDAQEALTPAQGDR